MTQTQKIEAERAASRIANLSIYTDAELVQRMMSAESAVSSFASTVPARYTSDAAQGAVTMYRNELQRRQPVAAQENGDRGTVTITSKLYKGSEWSTDRAEGVTSIEHAARMLARWSAMYSQPEAINTERGAKFWFRDDEDFNLLVQIDGASVNDLRAAYRECR